MNNESNIATTHEIVNSRLVHAAMARTVETAGQELSKDLYAAFLEFNEKYFNNVLTARMIEITAPASPNALATHQPVTPEGVECVIRIAPSVCEAGPNFYRDVLLHEMIHVWQRETDNSEPGYQGHGPKFAAKCNEIGAKLGLPEVKCRAKGEDKDCAQWPLNVRPEGYYGAHKRAVKAVTRARKPVGSRRSKRTVATQVAPNALELVLDLLPELNETERQLVASTLSAATVTIH